MGQVVTLQKGLYTYQLPPMPPEREIWFVGSDKKSQYWKAALPVGFKWLNPDYSFKDVKKMSQRDKIAYIDYWRNVWVNGLWIMNKGEPTYLTGAHVEHILFNEFNGMKLRYLSSQRLRFYFRELTNNDPLCDGRCWMKPRRAGITLEQITEAIRAVLSGFGNNVVYQSDTQAKAHSTLMKPTIDTYIRRPYWLREVFYTSNGKKPIKSLQLTTATIQEDNFALGGIIEALPTVASAADGKYAVLFVQDEFSKNETSDPYELFEVNKRAVHPEKQTKSDCLSTTGDTKDAQKATLAWHKLIANSNPLIRNKNGKTNSGLYKYFVDATDSMLLVKEIPDILDIYGDIDRARAEEWIWNEHNKYAPGSKEYIFSLYKLPLDEKHVLLSPTANSGYFNKIRISARLDALRALSFDQKPYVRGNLEEDSDGKVFFISDAERQSIVGKNFTIEPGKWLVAVLPYSDYDRNINLSNPLKREQNGIWLRPAQIEYAMGYDPIDYPKNLTTSNNLSRAAITVHKKFDYWGSGIEDEKVALYVGRPDSPHDANKEAMKACRLWGALCGHERSVSHVYEDFETAGMLSLLVQDDKGIYGFSHASMMVKKDGLSMLQSRYRNPQSPEEKDQIDGHPFEDSLVDLDGGDINDTTVWDIFMSEIYLEHTLKQMIFTNVSDTTAMGQVQAMHSIIPPRKH